AIADLGVGERAGPQRGRAVRTQSDRAIERARGVVCAAHAQQRVSESLPAEQMVRENSDRALELRGGFRESLVAEQPTRFLDERVRHRLAHTPGYHERPLV